MINCENDADTPAGLVIGRVRVHDELDRQDTRGAVKGRGEMSIISRIHPLGVTCVVRHRIHHLFEV